MSGDITPPLENQLGFTITLIRDTTKFNPEESLHDCPIRIEEITTWRKTTMRSLDGLTVDEEEDQWQRGGDLQYGDGGNRKNQFPGRATTRNFGWRQRTSCQTSLGGANGSTDSLWTSSWRSSEWADLWGGHLWRSGRGPQDAGQDEEAPEAGRTRALSEEDVEDGRPSKRIRTEFSDVYLQTLEKAIANELKKEVLYKNITAELKTKFDRAIQKEIKNNIGSGAYEILDRKMSEEIRREKSDKIVQSRYVLTEKQIGRETVLFSLQILAGLGWAPGYLDFTQAFHSGDALQREACTELPPERLPGCHSCQLLNLKKCCYGLLDWLFQWFSHLHAGFDQGARIRGECCRSLPISTFWSRPTTPRNHLRGHRWPFYTEEMRNTGRRWSGSTNINYRLGKFSRGDGRFVGNEIECKPDGSILVHQPLCTKEKVQEIPVPRERKSRKVLVWTLGEMTQLRGLLGSLAWLSKETGPDLAGRTALKACRALMSSIFWKPMH